LAPGVVAWIKAVEPVSQAEIVPFRLAKMKCAEPPFPPPPTGKLEGLEFSLATWPVGPTAPVPPGGIAILPVGGLTAVTLVTVVGPITDQRLVVFVTWFEIQKGLPTLCELPQGFIRLESVIVASPGMSETRSV
jgi:hypothetical protein